MSQTNRIVSLVRILESPKILDKDLSIQFRVQFPTRKKNKIVIANLIIWGNLVEKVNQYYKTNDYIIIEGYTSLPTTISLRSNTNTQQLKKVHITVSKIYPFLLQFNQNLNMALS